MYNLICNWIDFNICTLLIFNKFKDKKCNDLNLNIKNERKMQTKLLKNIHNNLGQKELNKSIDIEQKFCAQTQSEVSSICVNFLDETTKKLDVGLQVVSDKINEELQKIREERFELMIEDNVYFKVLQNNYYLNTSFNHRGNKTIIGK